MAFKIPEKAFLSFGRKQCLDTLWRIAQQTEMHWQKEKERTASLEALTRYLNVLSEHEDEYLQTLVSQFSGVDFNQEGAFQNFIMKIERELSLDLKDSDFLVSTEDDFEKVNTKLMPVHLVLDNLRSSFNVGSLFRTAEALGVEHIHLCGYTPTPENSKTAKSALGTDKWIEWSYWDNTLDCLAWLQEQKIKTYALETETSATSLVNLQASFPCAIFLGNERYGLGEPVLKKCDELVRIDLNGKKNSLNVGTCGAIVMHHLSTQDF